MNGIPQRTWRKIIAWGLVAFCVVNGLFWDLGWGSRHDRQPGREVERRFGWPANFYCDLWRSDHQHEISFANYLPPIPSSRTMYFVNWSVSILAFAVDAIFALCVIGVCVLRASVDRRGFMSWYSPLAAALLAVAVTIVQFGERFCAFL